MKIIFDYNRTLFNPDTDSLYQGVIGLLKNLSKKNELFLISRNELGRKGRLQELGIENYFKKMAFVEEKTLKIFEDLICDERRPDNKANVLVIGDRVKEEIFLGNQLGFITIWVQQGKFSNELPTKPEEQPIHTVKNIEDLKDIISKYEK